MRCVKLVPVSALHQIEGFPALQSGQGTYLLRLSVQSSRTW